MMLSIFQDGPKEAAKVGIKVRYAAQEVPALLKPTGDGQAKIDFDSSQRALTPGQAVVFYQNQSVLGGGTIDRVLN